MSRWGARKVTGGKLPLLLRGLTWAWEAVPGWFLCGWIQRLVWEARVCGLGRAALRVGLPEVACERSLFGGVRRFWSRFRGREWSAIRSREQLCRVRVYVCVCVLVCVYACMCVFFVCMFVSAWGGGWWSRVFFGEIKSV
jgi:hypothetical protein